MSSSRRGSFIDEVRTSVGKVGDTLVDGAKTVASVPGKFADTVVDGASAAVERVSSKGEASFSRLEEGGKGAVYTPTYTPPPAVEAKAEELVGRMATTMKGTNLACYRLAPLPVGATLAALLALPYALAQFLKLWLKHGHHIMHKLFRLKASGYATTAKMAAEQGVPTWKLYLHKVVVYVGAAAMVLGWFGGLVTFVVAATTGTVFLVGREAFDESTLFKLSQVNTAEGGKAAVGSFVTATSSKARRIKFAKKTSDKYGSLGRAALLLGDWVLLSGVVAALRIVGDLVAEAKPLFVAVDAALDALVAAAEKGMAAQGGLGLLKKTKAASGSSADEITTEAADEVGYAAHATPTPLADLKKEVTEEVAKAYETFKAKRLEGKGEGAAAAAVEAAAGGDGAQQAFPTTIAGLKKMIPTTEQKMAKVVGCVTIPLALVGWLIAVSSTTMEAALFIASATAFA